VTDGGTGLRKAESRRKEQDTFRFHLLGLSVGKSMRAVWPTDSLTVTARARISARLPIFHPNAVSSSGGGPCVACLRAGGPFRLGPLKTSHLLSF